MAGPSQRPPAHSFEEHPGELALRVEAPSLPALFAEAGRALAGVMSGSPAAAPDACAEEVLLEAPDREALLVDWLNELVFRSEVSKALFSEFDIRELGDRRLAATIRGTRVERLRNPVKAATYHGLSVAAPGAGFTATILLDV
jgi:SHS2 domain-containing protein